MRVGIAADHGGFTLKEQVSESLRSSGYDVVDFGAINWTPRMTIPTSSSPWPRRLPQARSNVEWRLRQRRGSVDCRQQGFRRACRAHP